jgi:hypothetical protein
VASSGLRFGNIAANKRVIGKGDARTSLIKSCSFTFQSGDEPVSQKVHAFSNQ